MEAFSQLRFPPPTYVSSWWQIVTNWYKTSQHTHIALKCYFPSYFSSVENISKVAGHDGVHLKSYRCGAEAGGSLWAWSQFALHLEFQASRAAQWDPVLKERGRKGGKRRVHWINHWQRSISHLVISKISYFCLTVGLVITADKSYCRSPNYLFMSVFIRMPSQRKWGKEFAFSSRGKLGSFPGTDQHVMDLVYHVVFGCSCLLDPDIDGKTGLRNF